MSGLSTAQSYVRRRTYALGLLAVAVLAAIWIGSARFGGRAPGTAPGGAEMEEMREGMQAIRAAAHQWQVWYGDAVCPSIRQTVEGKFLDARARKDDLWARPFVVTCALSGVVVTSLGPDGKKGTPDDIVVATPDSAPRGGN